jgi:hypothetical protein
MRASRAGFGHGYSRPSVAEEMGLVMAVMSPGSWTLGLVTG